MSFLKRNRDIDKEKNNNNNNNNLDETKEELNNNDQWACPSCTFLNELSYGNLYIL